MDNRKYSLLYKKPSTKKKAPITKNELKFLKAVAIGNYTGLRNMLDNGVSINTKMPKKIKNLQKIKIKWLNSVASAILDLDFNEYSQRCSRSSYHPLLGLSGLHIASKKLDLPMVKWLIFQGANVNTKDAYKHTPLKMLFPDCHSCNAPNDTPEYAKKFAIAKILMEEGLKPDTQGCLPLDSISEQISLKGPDPYRLIDLHLHETQSAQEIARLKMTHRLLKLEDVDTTLAGSEQKCYIDMHS